jgi:hypothetical protein
MRREIDPPIVAALLGKGQFARRRLRPVCWRLSFLVVTVGLWCLAGWAVSALLGGRT